MAKGLNKVMLIGNLGQDPEVKYTPAGVCVARLNVATNEGRKNKDGNWEEYTEWHRVVCYQKTAELAKDYLHKGSKVYIEGRLHTNSWDDEAGVKHYMTEIVARDLVFLDGKKGEGQPPDPTDDDLPF